jgi:iron(III) transport system ATP-binding protein
VTLETRSASVEFRHVIKSYGPVVAVRDVSFTVEAATLVTLLGPSDAARRRRSGSSPASRW